MAPLASCQSCNADLRVGSNIRPAKAPSVTGANGGRQIVVPIYFKSTFVALARTAAALTVSSFP